MSSQKYIIKFKKGASEEDVEKFYSEISKQGGNVTRKDHGSKILPRASADLPDSFVQNINGLTKDNKHDVVEYIEPDGEMKTQ